MKKVCINCGKEFYRRPSYIKDRPCLFCGNACRYEYKFKHKMSRKEICARYREKHKRAFEKMTYSEAKYRSKSYFGGLRDKALNRDKKVCRICGSPIKLIIHHLDGVRTHNVLDNLITLCRVCHPKVHNRYWRKDVMSL